MIRNLISEVAELKYFRSHLETKENFNFFIRLDSKNKVFKFHFYAPKRFCPYFELIGDFIQDKDFHELNSSLSSQIELHYQQGLSLDFDLAVTGLKRYLWELTGRMIDDSVNSNQVICRCQRIDKNKLCELANNCNFDQKQVIKASNISMICGACEEEFKESWDELLTVLK